MLRQRIFSALVMVPLALLTVWAGFPLFDGVVALAAVLMVWEWEAMCCHRFTAFGALVAGVILVAVLLGAHLPLLSLLLLALLCGGLLWQGRSRWLAWGALYIGVPAVSLVWLRESAGVWSLLWLMVAVWSTDIGAYAAGRTIGGARLAPRISPNKTWAGLIGGVIAAMTISSLVLALADGQHYTAHAMLAALVAVISQGGDLFESSVKRRFGVKDSSALIPGHGGVLDRVDGLIAAAPLVALAVWVSGNGLEQW